MKDEDLSALLGEEAPQAHDLKALTALAAEAVALERECDAAEERFEDLKARLHHMKTRVLPDAMLEVGLMGGELKLPDGSRISVGDFVSGSLPKDAGKRIKALDHLAEIGGEALIKNQLSIEFAKKESNRALDLAERLRSEGYEPKVKGDVHPQKLAAFVREKLRAGEPINAEVLGCFVGRKADIKLGKIL